MARHTITTIMKGWGVIALAGFGAIFVAKQDIDRRRRRDDLRRKTEYLEQRVKEKEAELKRKQEALELTESSLGNLDKVAKDALAIPSK